MDWLYDGVIDRSTNTGSAAARLGFAEAKKEPSHDTMKE